MLDGLPVQSLRFPAVALLPVLRHDRAMLPRSTPSELLTTAEMATADRLTIAAGIPGAFLMDRAGTAVAKAASRLLETRRPQSGRIAIFCGPGNNGGDGFVAARYLHADGFEVSLGLLGARESLEGDTARAAQDWSGDVFRFEDVRLEKADLAIVAIFGAGLARDIDGAARDAILRLNEWTRRTRKPIVAVDIPSGIDGSSGQVRGVAVEATQTVTFFRLKPGHLLLPGYVHCGEISLVDVGIPDSVLTQIQPQTFANGPSVWSKHFPRPRIDGHKYMRGHALVLSGSLAHTGAARLAARGALRVGAGLVTVATPQDALAVHAAALTAIMTRVCDNPEDLTELLADHRKNAVIMGPGLGVGGQTRALVFAALAKGAQEPHRAIVLDADALTSFAGEPMRLAEAVKDSDKAVVLTPHDGEFAQLFAAKEGELGDHPDVAQLASPSKLARTRAAAALIGAVIVLKGADTVVADPQGRATIGHNAPPWLATAGSGDVLAGLIGGLLAQGMPAFEAASAAVWLHAAAAREFGAGLIAEDIPECLPAVLRRLLDAGA
jgi:ADP-dependent NAD(P)H-hydrate dehydratase / NAD(P)H-hydrate epimerase